jgi:uncharacterized membrane protein YoaT (DUF817 family)
MICVREYLFTNGRRGHSLIPFVPFQLPSSTILCAALLQYILQCGRDCDVKVAAAVTFFVTTTLACTVLYMSIDGFFGRTYVYTTRKHNLSVNFIIR